MTKTKHPRRNKVRVQRLRAECERILNVPWPEEAVPESVTEPMRQRYLKTRQIVPVNPRNR